MRINMLKPSVKRGAKNMNKTDFINFLKKEKTIALDTNVFIYQFQNHPRFSRLSNEIFLRVDKKQLKIITSFVSFLEVLSHKGLKHNFALIDSYKTFFLNTDGLAVIFPDTKIAEKAAELRRELNLSTPDALQAATAIENGAKIFITNDPVFKKIPQLKVLLLKSFI